MIILALSQGGQSPNIQYCYFDSWKSSIFQPVLQLNRKTCKKKSFGLVLDLAHAFFSFLFAKERQYAVHLLPARFSLEALQ